MQEEEEEVCPFVLAASPLPSPERSQWPRRVSEFTGAHFTCIDAVLPACPFLASGRLPRLFGWPSPYFLLGDSWTLPGGLWLWVMPPGYRKPEQERRLGPAPWQGLAK